MVQEDREQKVRHSTPMSFEQLVLMSLIGDEPPLVNKYVPDTYELEGYLPIYIKGLLKRALEIRVELNSGLLSKRYLIKMSEIREYFKGTGIRITVTPKERRLVDHDLVHFSLSDDTMPLNKNWVKLTDYV